MRHSKAEDGKRQKEMIGTLCGVKKNKFTKYLRMDH